MKISVENASPDYSRSVNGIPPIDTQRALTTVLVPDGDTTVIGGIYVSREQATQAGVVHGSKAVGEPPLMLAIS